MWTGKRSSNTKEAYSSTYIMSLIRNLRSGITTLPDFYERVTTEGDSSNFLGSNVGQQVMVRPTDTAAINSNIPADVVFEAGDVLSGQYLITLPFSYLVGADQLLVLRRQRVYMDATDEGLGTVWTWPQMVKRSRIEQITTPDGMGADPDSTSYPNFEEASTTTVRVYNVDETDPLLILIPHTSIPAEIRERVTIRDQGDNQAIELLGKNDGILMRSPNGSRHLIRVDDSGNLVIEPK
jgi:hypothetical protein